MSPQQLGKCQRIILGKGVNKSRVLVREWHQVQEITCLTRSGQQSVLGNSMQWETGQACQFTSERTSIMISLYEGIVVSSLCFGPAVWLASLTAVTSWKSLSTSFSSCPFASSLFHLAQVQGFIYIVAHVRISFLQKAK